MPGRKKMIPTPEGILKPGTIVDIVSSSEYFNVYNLEDGAVVKLKAIAVECIRMDEGKDPEGNPIYVLASKNVITLASPPNK